MLRYILALVLIYVGVHAVVHAGLMPKPAFIESFVVPPTTENHSPSEAVAPAPVSEEAPAAPMTAPTPTPVVESAPGTGRAKASEAFPATPAATPKATQGHHSAHAKKTLKNH